MNENRQRSLFPEPGSDEAGSSRSLTAEASILATLGQFEVHMRDEGFALNTVKAFASDVRLLGKYLGIGQPIGEVSTKNLNDFLNWLLYERGVPCSPKSYARRVTTLKVFFKWLQESGVLPADPATAVIQHSVKSPLPVVPNEGELERALVFSNAWRQADEQRKADARPHLLLTLLLQTGIKKSEAMNMVPNHVDRSDPQQPMLFIRSVIDTRMPNRFASISLVGPSKWAIATWAPLLAIIPKLARAPSSTRGVASAPSANWLPSGIFCPASSPLFVG